MAKDELNQYSKTAASNTDVGGVGLGEGTMVVSDINNAMRELMSHLAAFADGTDHITKLDIGDGWTVEKDASNNLMFAYNGADKMKLTSSGNLSISGSITATGNITAYGTF